VQAVSIKPRQVLAVLVSLLFGMAFSSVSFGQNPGPSQQPSLPSVRLDISSTTEVPGISEPFLTDSICSPDNAAFMTRMIGPTGEGDVEVISNDGKNVIRLNAGKVTDINKPFIEAFTANESSIYLLIEGHKLEDKTFAVRSKPDGQAETMQAYTRQAYVARFRRDGSYAGSVALDLPFTPMQFGAFAHGDFFFAGAMKDTGEPKAALVKSTGQFDRFLELLGDIHPRSESDQAASGHATGDRLSLPRKAGNYKDTLEFALGFSMVVPDGPNLLLIRPGQQSPVFSVSPGGVVQPVTLEIPEGFKLFDLKTTRHEWIATFTRPSQDPNIKGFEARLYALNKTTGKLQIRYIFPPTLGVALTCSDGHSFTVLTRENDTLQLITLSPVQ
jgi:hypothetical protein